MLTLLASLMAGAGLVLAALAAYVAWRRGTRMGWSLAVMLVAVAWWGTAYAVELSVSEIPVKSMWGDLKYAGVVTLAPAWLVFVLQYTGRGQLITRRLVALLAVPPVAAMVVLAVPATHDLVRFYPDTAGTEELPIVGTGPAFWVIFGYNNLLLVAATALFLASMVRLARTYRRMAMVLLASALLPWAANILHNLEVGWFARIDLTPFAFIVTGGLLVWGLFEERLVDLAPLARSAVVESMADAVFVLDAFGRIVDVNPAAVALADRSRVELVGRRLLDLVELSGIAEVGPSGLVLGDPASDDRRTFDVSQQPLMDVSGRTAGELVVLREVTDRVRDQQHLQDVLDDRSRVAATLQASMVPARLPAVLGCELASRYVPAGDGGEIGGDFLDVFALDEETWGFVLGDVSGKGAEAAAVSAATRYTLRALAAADASPAVTLREVNTALLAQTESERHCTLVHGHLRPPPAGDPGASVHITLSLAGHHWPLRLTTSGAVDEVGTLGTALALFDDPELHDAEVELAPGEVLVMFTDGLLEARRGRDEFGAERVADMLRTHRDLSAEELAGAVLEAVRAFHGDELGDDLAMLVVKRL
ncbi:serine phosphatase RsbU (regulator of sigma subunit) [Nocardioides sp. BE266]|uniref:histidine kinase N-terminal 7TM domain-containing protein n=1 Tax=Nocardioides sp. BE266 TaxID=2817725 RepID=UPI00286485BF|nr:histidine kinase N-terminal 7TM domain-containing protein [Nocardioides sp. BE266]MDR7255155.1 serine phosphatase RsbU (regulator of sigma subunit) [Nocardioides sp. BE266]